MVLAIRYDTTTQDALSIWPRLEAMAGSAVATMVWSATARNIGSMIDGKTVKNSDRGDGVLSSSPSPSFVGWAGSRAERFAVDGGSIDCVIACRLAPNSPKIQMKHCIRPDQSSRRNAGAAWPFL